MVWGLKVHYQSYMNQITSPYPPVCPQVFRIIIFLIIFFTITLYVFSFTTMHAICPTDVSCRGMVILIQYLIQTFEEPKLMSVMSKVRKFNCDGGINPTLHR
jgi:ABC-type multidrug transport system permease subunit